MGVVPPCRPTESVQYAPGTRLSQPETASLLYFKKFIGLKHTGISMQFATKILQSLIISRKSGFRLSASSWACHICGYGGKQLEPGESEASILLTFAAML
jgi:hypothetical protein